MKSVDWWVSYIGKNVSPCEGIKPALEFARNAKIFNRLFIWPLVVICYGSLAAAMLHTIFRNWSGAASFGMGFSVLVGAPVLVGYAGLLWRKNMLKGVARWEAIICASYPLMVLLLFGFALLLGR